jgi:hypothetical protein
MPESGPNSMGMHVIHNPFGLEGWNLPMTTALPAKLIHDVFDNIIL